MSSLVPNREPPPEPHRFHRQCGALSKGFTSSQVMGCSFRVIECFRQLASRARARDSRDITVPAGRPCDFRDFLVGQLLHFTQYDNLAKIGGKILDATFDGPRALIPQQLGLRRCSSARVKSFLIFRLIGPRAIVAQPRK